MFKSLISKLFKVVGSLNGSGSSKECLRFFFDEPEMPKSMIER